MTQNEKKTRRCDICNIDVHRASHAKNLRSKKHLENVRQDDMIIPDWLFLESYGKFTNISIRIYNRKASK